MSKTLILQKFRKCLQRGDFTMRAASIAAGIPYTTLAEMKRPEYSDNLQEKLGRLEALEKAMDQMLEEREPTQ